MASVRRWQCKNKACRKQFSIKVGTVMEDSPIGLDKWLCAIWLITNAKNGISSYEIHRAIGVTQRRLGSSFTVSGLPCRTALWRR
jgi:transposase-like protein